MVGGIVEVSATDFREEHAPALTEDLKNKNVLRQNLRVN